MRLIDPDAAFDEIDERLLPEDATEYARGVLITSFVMMTVSRSFQRMVVARYLMRLKGHGLTSKHFHARKLLRSRTKTGTLFIITNA